MSVATADVCTVVASIRSSCTDSSDGDADDSSCVDPTIDATAKSNSCAYDFLAAAVAVFDIVVACIVFGCELSAPASFWVVLGRSAFLVVVKSWMLLVGSWCGLAGEESAAGADAAAEAAVFAAVAADVGGDVCSSVGVDDGHKERNGDSNLDADNPPSSI